MPHLECSAAQQSAGRLGSHDGREFVFFRKCRHHFARAGSVLVHHQHNTPVKAARTKAFSDHQD